MTKDSNRQAAFTAGSWFKDHDVILNTLERENKGMYLSLAAFEGTETAWNGLPVIFADDHPDMDLFEEDPGKALALVNGKIIGTTKGAYIDMAGHPWLAATLVLDDDAGVEQLITPPGGGPGMLSLSTAFWHGGMKQDKDLPVPVLQGPVDPQHVLLFIEDATTNDTPGDKGAFILNKQSKEDNNLSDEAEALSLLDKARALFAKAKKEPAVLQEGDAVEVPPPNAPIVKVVEAAAEAVQDVVEAEIAYDPEKLAKSLAVALATISELKARVAELEGTQAAAEEETAELKWQAMRAKLPDGVVHGEKEAVVRKLWDEQPHDFAIFLAELKADPELPGQDGAEFTAGDGGVEGGETASVGWPDPDTGVWSN